MNNIDIGILRIENERLLEDNKYFKAAIRELEREIKVLRANQRTDRLIFGDATEEAYNNASS